MKKNIWIIVVGLFISLISISYTYAQWDDCPKGLVNDPYPGECSRYIDTDGDGICDHSQPAPEDRVTEDSSSEDATYTAVPLIEDADGDTPTASAVPVNISETVDTTQKTSSNSKYNFWAIFISLLVIYAISYVLMVTKKISLVAHRKFWNVMLLVTFVVCALTGIFLTIRVENPGLLTLPYNFLFLHVEFGLAMALISIFHVLWHWNYYINMFKSKSKNTNTPSQSSIDNSKNNIDR
jgi:hypothetical protein